jgi:hypothetical protein
MLKEATFGAVVGFVGIVALARCGATVPLVRCELDALHALPRDTRQLTLGDLEDARWRLRMCQAQGDAGGER